MLKETSAPAGEVDFEADVSVNTLTTGVILDFVKPDITSLDGFEDLFLKRFGKFIPPLRCHVNTLLDPGQISTCGVYKLF